MSERASVARKAQELIDRLKTLGADDAHNEWALRKLANDARSLMHADAVEAHIVLGGIAALEGNTAHLHEHYRISMQLAGHSVHVLHNYAVSLSRVGEVEEAFKWAMQAHERAPDNIGTLGAAVAVAVQSGHFRAARDLYHRWQKLCPDKPFAESEGVVAAAEAIERGAFTEERAQAVIHLAEEVQREAGHQSRGCMVLALHGEPDNVLFEVMVRARTGEALDLNEEFADRIVANEELMSDPGRNFVLVFIGTKTDDSDTRATP